MPPKEQLGGFVHCLEIDIGIAVIERAPLKERIFVAMYVVLILAAYRIEAGVKVVRCGSYALNGDSLGEYGV